MLFDTTTAPQLKPWLVRTLEPVCDAEPGALAEYILALLKHNVPESEMRKELTAQLDEFLEKECSTFIDTLFTVLRTKTYLPYGTTDSTPKQPRAMEGGIPIPLDVYMSPGSPERGQKRSMDYDDRDGRPAKGPRLSADGYGRYPNGNGRGNGQWGGHGGMDGGMNGGGMGMGGGMSMDGQMNGRRNQSYQPPDPKRGLCRDYHNNGYCARGATCKYSHGEEAVIPGQLYPGQQIPPGGAPPMPYMGMFANGGMPYGMAGQAYDPNEARLDMTPIGGMGMGMGGGMGSQGSNGATRPRVPIIRRTQDEEGRVGGVEHNQNASGELPVIQDLTPKVARDESQDSQSHPQTQPYFQAPNPQDMNGAGSVYMPNGISNIGMEIDDMGGLPPNMQGGFRGPRGGGRGRGAYSNNSENHMRPQKGGRSDKTLVVEKIPEDKLSLDAVNGWFKRFGTVTNVAIDARGAKALVTFTEHEEAHKAWKSEDAVFGNRFVKLFWHRPMEGHGQGGARALAASANLVANINGKEQGDTALTPASQPTSAPTPSTSVLKRKLVNSAASALAAKQQLLEQQITEQKSLMTQLSTASADEKKQIMSRLRKLGEEMKPAPSPSGTPALSALPIHNRASRSPILEEHERKEKERLDKELEGHSAVSGSQTAGSESTDDLKAKLAKLKAEAASLGLPEAASETPVHHGSYRPYRGRGRATRSYHRGSTMRGGPPRASMKLDNRPKKLLVKGANEDGLQAVRDWYETTGQVESTEVVGDGDIVVSFKTRSAAEQGLAKGTNISQVGQVQVTWQTGHTPGTTAQVSKMTPTVTPKDASDNKMTEDDPANTGTGGDERHHSPNPTEDEVVASGWGGHDDEDGMGML